MFGGEAGDSALPLVCFYTSNSANLKLTGGLACMSEGCFRVYTKCHNFALSGSRVRRSRGMACFVHGTNYRDRGGHVMSHQNSKSTEHLQR